MLLVLTRGNTRGRSATLVLHLASILTFVGVPVPAIAQTAHYGEIYWPDWVYAAGSCMSEYDGTGFLAAHFDYSNMTFEIEVDWEIDCTIPDPILLWESDITYTLLGTCLLYTSPSPRDS